MRGTVKPGRLAPLLACCLALLLAKETTCDRGPAAISTSVIITGFSDLEGRVDGGVTPCVYTITRSRGFGSKRINFVVTLHAKGDTGKLDGYYYQDGYGNLVQADQGQIGRFKNGLQKCFQAAIDAGFTTLHVLPHVDPERYDGKGFWRNILKFDPLQKLGSGGAAYSYEDVLIRPTAEAINAVARADTQVEFTIAGEQGLSIFKYPRSWISVLNTAKSVTSQGKDASKYSAGVSFNWDKICGCVEPEERDPIKYNSTYLERFGRFVKAGGLKTIDVAGVKELLDKSDFIGASGYASTALAIVPASHEVSIETVNFEFLSFGIDLKDYMFNKNKPFYYSEQGLGGCESNGRIAPNVQWVAKHPFWGVWRKYSPAVDPWQNQDYKGYRRKFYEALSIYAQRGGGPQYRMDGIYLWSVGSWDVHGVHPSSNSNSGSFKDDVIINYIKEANAVASRR